MGYSRDTGWEGAVKGLEIRGRGIVEAWRPLAIIAPGKYQSLTLGSTISSVPRKSWLHSNRMMLGREFKPSESIGQAPSSPKGVAPHAVAMRRSSSRKLGPDHVARPLERPNAWTDGGVTRVCGVIQMSMGYDRARQSPLGD